MFLNWIWKRYKVTRFGQLVYVEARIWTWSIEYWSFIHGIVFLRLLRVWIAVLCLQEYGAQTPTVCSMRVWLRLERVTSILGNFILNILLNPVALDIIFVLANWSLCVRLCVILQKVSFVTAFNKLHFKIKLDVSYCLSLVGESFKQRCMKRFSFIFYRRKVFMILVVIKKRLFGFLTSVHRLWPHEVLVFQSTGIGYLISEQTDLFPPLTCSPSRWLSLI